ncbi:CLAVATA3/ESR protein [Nymphaea thermarum]|nr:CLAVATA3/ESR protein [Nymphaea thermarum]
MKGHLSVTSATPAIAALLLLQFLALSSCAEQLVFSRAQAIAAYHHHHHHHRLRHQHHIGELPHPFHAPPSSPYGIQLPRIQTFRPAPPTSPPPPPPLTEELDPRYGVEKRLVPTGPNPLHN